MAKVAMAQVREIAAAKGVEIGRPAGWSPSRPGSVERSEGPQWELIAPEGFCFNGDCHYLLGWTVADLYTDLTQHELTPCPADCDTCYEEA